MPSSVDIPGVILQLSHVSKETGVSFQSITPHDPVVLGSYQQIPINLVFEGRFYDLADFLYRLRNLVAVHGGALHATGRLFTVDSIAFDQGSLEFPQVKATLTVSAYNFGDGTTPPAPAACEPVVSVCERGLAAHSRPRRQARRPPEHEQHGGSGAGQEARPASEAVPRRRHGRPARRSLGYQLPKLLGGP